MGSDLGIRASVKAVQDHRSLPAQTSVYLSRSSRLLRLADLARELASEPVADEARELAAWGTGAGWTRKTECVQPAKPILRRTTAHARKNWLVGAPAHPTRSR